MEPAIKTAQQIIDDEVNLADMHKLLMELMKPATVSAIELFVRARQLQQMAEAVQKAIMLHANAEFGAKADNSTDTQWPVLNALLTNNAGKGSWLLSPELVEAADALSAKIELYKKANPGKYTAGTLDARKTALFKISFTSNTVV